MKNILSLSAGVLLAVSFTACQNNANNPEADARNRRTMDSTVNARIQYTRDSLARECNTQVMAMANYRADSIIAARAGRRTTAPRPTTTVTQSTGTTTTQQTQQGGGKLSDRAQQQDGKLKDRVGADTTRQGGGKLRDRTP